MIFSFDAFNRYESPTLTLCNPNDKPLGLVSNYSDLNIDICFNSNSEISFKVSKLIDGKINSLYSKLQTKREILVSDLKVRNESLIGLNRDLGYFIITDVSESYSEDNVEKTITANSCEYELNKIELHYVDGVYQMYEEGNNDCLLNQIMKRLPKWTLKHVDKDVAELSRTFDFGKSTVYGFLMSEFAESYGVIVEYDVLNRTISIYNESTYIASNSQRTHIAISVEDIVDNIKTDEDIDELYTALYVPSDGGLNISTVNPSRENTVYNFKPFMNTDWMSKELIDALKELETARTCALGSMSTYAYQEKVASDVTLGEDETVTVFPTSGQAIGDYYIATHNYNKTLSGVSTELLRSNNCTLYTWNGTRYIEITYSEITTTRTLLTLLKYEKEKYITIKSELDTLQNADLVNLNKQKAAIVSSSAPVKQKNESLAKINKKISIVEDKIEAKKIVLNDKASVCDKIENKLDDIANDLKLENALTNEQLVELSSFISEGSFEDDTITVTDSMTYAEEQEQSQALYDKAVELLEKISTPNIEFDIDIDGIVFNKEFQHLTEEINTGCIIGVFDSNDEFCEYVLLKISIDYESQSVKMTFGNRFKLQNLFDDLYDQPAKTGNTVNYIKDIFDFNKANNEIKSNEEFRNSSLDLTRNAIVSSNNQDMIMDDTGLRGRKYDPVIKDFVKEQMWLCNNTLAFTDDGFNTVKTAFGKIPLNCDYNGDGEINEQDYVYGLNADAIIAGSINAGLIKAGKLQSQDGSCYFDLDNNKILANRLGGENCYAQIGHLLTGRVGLDIYNNHHSFASIAELVDGGFGINNEEDLRFYAAQTGTRLYLHDTARVCADDTLTGLYDDTGTSRVYADKNMTKLNFNNHSKVIINNKEGIIWFGSNAIGVDSKGAFKVVNGYTSYL